MPGRKCSICYHKQRADIDRAIQNGTAYRNISERYQVALGSIARHKQHITAQTEPEGLRVESGTKRNIKTEQSGTGELSEKAKAIRRAYRKQWGKDHKEKQRAYQKKYAQAHREKRNAYYRAYCKKHPERKAEYNKSYWERKAQEGG